MFCGSNPLNAELNPTCHLLALLVAHHIFHVSRIRVNGDCCSGDSLLVSDDACSDFIPTFGETCGWLNLIHSPEGVSPEPLSSTPEIVVVRSSEMLALLYYPYLLTPWCRVLLEKLTGLQLVKKFPTFYGTLRFITAFTSVRHLSLSCASPIQSTYPHPTSWRPILILSTHPRLGLPSGLFPSGFSTKTLYASLSSPIRTTCPTYLYLALVGYGWRA